MNDKVLNIFKASKLDLTDLCCYTEFGSALDKSLYDLSPKDFIRFAKIDLLDESERGFINSLTNSKRAIDCQVDNLLDVLGIKSDDFNKDFLDFLKLFEFDKDIPVKLKMIHSINLAPTLLLTKTRTLRNKLEHFYQKPTRDEVREALDVADLFIRCVDGKTSSVWEFYLTDGNNWLSETNQSVNKNLYFAFDDKLKRFSISLRTADGEEYITEEVFVDGNDKVFIALLNLMFSVLDEFDCKDALIKLLKFIEHPIPSKNINVDLLF
jgi:hypothetical protein